jgi:DHA1 family putative efflux transporter-like MFS transporter
MVTEENKVKQSLRSRLFLPALLLAEFLIGTYRVFLNNALVDVASSLKVTVGTASQIFTVSTVVGLIVGIAIGFLAIRFKHKSLFLLGLAFYAVGALGCFFAPDFYSTLFFNIFLGIGYAMGGIMIITLVGDFLPLKKKGMAIGLVVGFAFVADLVVAQVTSVITNAAGWRAVLLWFIFPIAVASLLLGFLVLPSKPHQELTADKPQYLEAFKQVLLNKSALACQIATALVYVSVLVPVYAVSFYILDFHESLSTGAIFYSLASAMGILGVVVGGRLINQVGRKPLTVATGAIQGIFAILIVFAPNVDVSVVMWMASAGFASALFAALISLALEQVPDFRGTMMSLNTSFQNIGIIVGLTVSGLVLNLYANNFQILFTIFGTAGVASAAVVFLFAKDPCKNQLPQAT